MTLMPDDEPEQLPPPAVIPLDVDFLPALVGTESPVGPARAYLLSLNSPRSRQTMAPRPWSPAAGAACAVITLWP